VVSPVLSLTKLIQHNLLLEVNYSSNDTFKSLLFYRFGCPNKTFLFKLNLVGNTFVTVFNASYTKGKSLHLSPEWY